MTETGYKEVKSWPRVDMFRGIRMKYKGKEFCFPAVYIGPSEMSDFEVARASVEYKEANEEQRESVATKKAMTLCSRVLLQDAYEATEENMDLQEKYEDRKRDRRKIEKQIASTEDETTIESLTKKLEAIPALPSAEKVFPHDETVLSFGVTNMSGTGTRMVDNIRMIQAYSKLNYFQQEEVEDFMYFPGA